VRRELRARPAEEAVPAVKAWAAKVQALPEDKPSREKARLLCEALWVLQGHHAVDPELLKTVLGSFYAEARAAAVRVAADEREYIKDAFGILKKAAADEHPRVRCEALRGLSFYPTQESMNAVLASAKMPLDYWTKYTLEATLGANEAVWRPDFLAGKIGKDNPEAEKIMAGILASSKAGGAAAPHLRVLLGTEPQSVEVKNKATTELAKLRGNVNRGREVFVRSCTACHKVGNGEGQEYGPNLAGVATRWNRMKIIESIIDPNAELDAKFASTRIVTFDGKTIVGLVVAETKKEVAIFDGKEKKTIPIDDIETRTVLKQSSMPEGQAAAMSPAEFIDLIEYLSAQNQKQ
jgi:putative heme-binding domain-containing protein